MTGIDFSKGDWYATAHIRFLRAQGGAGADYTADLIEKLATSFDAQEAAFAERMAAAREVIETKIVTWLRDNDGCRRNERIFRGKIASAIERGDHRLLSSTGTTDTPPLAEGERR